MEDLHNKVVIITGASSGIGRATAIQFAKKGAQVVLAARRVEKLQALHKKINQFNSNGMYIKTDVTREDQVIRLFEETMNRFGRVDMLINNAGRGLKADIPAISVDEWTAVLETNLSSVFLCSKEALKYMTAEKRGHIITVSSIAGLYGMPGYAAYCAAKHGVTGFQRSLKWEARRNGIKVSTVFPGRVNTEFFDRYPSRPSMRHMLSAEDLADFIICVAEQRSFKRQAIRLLNMLKRVRNGMRSGRD